MSQVVPSVYMCVYVYSHVMLFLWEKRLALIYIESYYDLFVICDINTICLLGFLGGSDGKESACNAGDLGLIPGVGRSPRGGHGNPLKDSGMENHMDRGAWWAIVHEVTKSQTQLSD